MHGTLTIEFLSDTCFSMPSVLNVTVDSEVCMDDLGLPMIPGKTIRSLLRDTWLSAQPVLDPECIGYMLFGREGAHKDDSSLRIGNAMMDAAIRARIYWAIKRENNPLPVTILRDAFYDIRVQTKIDRASGAPETDTLRGVRVVPAGARLYAPLDFHNMDADALNKTLIKLDCLLGATRHGGLDRNRGLGHIKLNASLILPKSHASAVCELKLSHIDITESTASVNKQTSAPNLSGNRPVFLPFRLTLTAPCLIQDRSKDPNSSSTRSFIPGAAIRGAIAAAMVRRGDSPEQIHEMVASGKVRFLNAYIEEREKRSIPTPCTFQRIKDAAIIEDDKASPRNILTQLFDDKADPPETQYQPLKSKYLTPLSADWIPADVKIGSHTHQTRDRARGVAIKNETTVFVYEFLKEGQSFQGCLAGDAELCAKAQELMLSEPIWLGRSAHAEYGGAPEVEFLSGDTSEIASMNQSHIIKGDQFAVLLTSPAVLRDPVTGQHDPHRLHAEMEERFKGQAEVKAACVKLEQAQEFNRLWRTSLPELPAAAAGSMVLLDASADISSEELLALQATPIGERTAQGYGCFIILTGDLQTLTLNSSVKQKIPEPSSNISNELKKIQRKLYENRLRLLMTEKAVDLANNAKLHGVSPHLIQRMRTPLHGNVNWRETWREWLDNNKPVLKDTALNPLKESYMNRQPLAKYLLNAAQENWAPDLHEMELIEQKTVRILSDESAEALWNDEKSKLTVYFLDTLLNRLARKAKGEREIG
jgi:CRISPR-associated protein Csx10